MIPMMFAAVDLGEHFAKEDSWTESSVDFAVEHQRDGFGFASQKRDIVNCMEHALGGFEVFLEVLYLEKNVAHSSMSSLSMWNPSSL